MNFFLNKSKNNLYINLSLKNNDKNILQKAKFSKQYEETIPLSSLVSDKDIFWYVEHCCKGSEYLLLEKKDGGGGIS